jgi:hypothetical protein
MATSLARGEWRISNDADRVKSFFFFFLLSSRTPTYERRCAALFDESSAADPLSSVFTRLAQPVSVHQSGVAHQPSLRSRSTMMSYSNSLSFREAGSLISVAVTALQDYAPLLASPHGHHCFSAASGRGDRTLGNRFGCAA